MSSGNGIVEAILKSRILREGETTWDDVCARVARAIGNTEDERHDFYALMKSGQFIPNSPNPDERWNKHRATVGMFRVADRR